MRTNPPGREPQRVASDPHQLTQRHGYADPRQGTQSDDAQRAPRDSYLPPTVGETDYQSVNAQCQRQDRYRPHLRQLPGQTRLYAT